MGVGDVNQCPDAGDTRLVGLYERRLDRIRAGVNWKENLMRLNYLVHGLFYGLIRAILKIWYDRG
jgi:hypothetical protein